MTGLFGGAHPDYDLLLTQADKLQRITGEYKLKLEIMRRIDSDFGPLDWRVPESHAIYWAVCGRKYGGKDDALQCERVIFQSLKALFMHGRQEAGTDGRLIQEPDMDLLGKITKAYEAVRAKYPEEVTIKSSHIDFLREAVNTLNTHNRQTEARDLFNSISAKFPSDETSQGYEAFVSRSRNR